MKKSTNKFGRRALAMLLALTMCFSMCMSAFADGADASAEPEHTDDCYEYFVLTCGKEVSEGHAHGDGCYETVETPVESEPEPEVPASGENNGEETGEPAGDEGTTGTESVITDSPMPMSDEPSKLDSEPKLICGQKESEGHSHTLDCYQWKEYQWCVDNIADFDPSIYTVNADPQVPGNYKRLTDHTHESAGDTGSNEEPSTSPDAPKADDTDNQPTTDPEPPANDAIVPDGPSADELPSDEAGAPSNGALGITEDKVRTPDSVLEEIKEAAKTGKTVDIPAEFVVETNETITVTATNGLTLTGSGTLKAIGEGFPVITVDGGKLIINGVTITGGKNFHTSSNGGKGGGVYVKNGTLEMQDGKISGNEAHQGGGVYVAKGTFNMTGGTIGGDTEGDGNKAVESYTTTDKKGNVTNHWGQGGGVYVANNNGAKFTMGTEGGRNANASIKGNTAAEGGGIFINGSSTGGGSLTMYSGTIKGNTATEEEAGGIYISSNAENTIIKGLIEGNKTVSTTTLGGGGIYIENFAKLHMVNTLITQNTAWGLGAGLAACTHGRTMIFTDEGASIYGNFSQANQNGITGSHGNPVHVADGVDQSDTWANNSEFWKAAQDILIAAWPGKTFHGDGLNKGVIISNNLNGVAEGTANWNGMQFSGKENETSSKVTLENNSIIASGNLTGLTANLLDSVKEALDKLWNQEDEYNGVVIKGNHSNVHGGGIANNGYLTIGSVSESVEGKAVAKVNITKKWISSDSIPAGLTATVTVEGENGTVFNREANFTSDKAEDTKFVEIPQETLTAGLAAPTVNNPTSVTKYFKVSETTGSCGDVQYDETSYHIVIKVKAWVQEIIIQKPGNTPTEDWTNGWANTASDTKYVTHYDLETVTLEGADVSATIPVTFTNTYTKPKEGSLKVTKVIDNTATGFDAQAQTYTFQLTEKVGDGVTTSPRSWTQEANAANNFVATFEKLPYGNYTLTEITTADNLTGYDAAKHNWKVEYTDGVDVTIAENKKYEKTVKNTFSDKPGNLTIKKTFTGAASTDRLFVTFNVTGPAAVADKSFESDQGRITFKGNTATVGFMGTDGITIKNLPAGEYTVEEPNGNIEGYKWTVTGGGKVTVPAADTGIVTFNNHYAQERGSLTINKTVTGVQNKDTTDRTFIFTIQGPGDSDVVGATFNEKGEATVEVTPGTPVVITKLPVGEYTVTETGGYTIDGYDLKTERAPQTLMLKADDKTGIVAGIEFNFDNNYAYQRGNLTISKKVTDSSSESNITYPNGKEFTFTISTDAVGILEGDTGYTTEPSDKKVTFNAQGVATVTLKDGESVTIKDLPYGNYNVEEADDSVNVPAHVQWTQPDKVSGSIIGGITAAFENVYDYKRGSLIIEKRVTGAAPASQTGSKEFTFKVQGPDYVTGTYSGIKFDKGAATVTITGPKTVTISGLPYGEYTVTEEAAGISGYIWRATGDNGQTKEINENGNAEFVVTNSYDVPYNPGTPRPVTTPTPAPTSTPTPTSKPTVTPAPTPDDDIPDDPVPMGTPKPEDTPTPTPAVTPAPTPDEDIPDDPVPLGTPKPENTPTPAPEATPTPEPDEPLPEPDVPTGPSSPEEDIPDDDVPLASAPKTGDDTNIWYVLTILSAAGLVFMAVSGRKRKEDAEK